MRSDPRLLEQIIRNLLSNAFQYTRKGKVLLGCRRYGDQLRIEVWDTGSGIPDSELSAIFEEFHRIDRTASPQAPGLGLGLAIVQRLGSLLQHRIDVRSRVGKGSVFRVEVPIGRRAGGFWRRHETPVASSGEFRSGNILIIEDDPAVREMLEILLTGEGHHVLSAADGIEAMNMVTTRERPDLILADYSLPNGMNGLEVIERLRAAHGKGVAAVVLAGDVSKAAIGEIVRYGYPRLLKPVNADELLAVIQRLLVQPGADGSLIGSDPRRSDDLFRPTIFVVDDDHGTREALKELIEIEGGLVESYASAEAFLEGYRPSHQGCLVVDEKMPGMGGVELLERLSIDGRQIPAIVITAHGDAPTAIRAMRAGAADFIEKPVSPEELLASLERVVRQSQSSQERSAWRTAQAARIAVLTERQRQVMELVVAGYANKEIAARLGINQRTVESHRALIMKKTGAKSLADLVRLALVGL